jgi:hypothetical protein
MITLDYFWFHRRDEDFPPPSQQSPQEGVQGERLNVACTQTDLPDRQQRVLVQEWCELLPTLAHVRFLWLSTRVPQALFDAACHMPGLEGLYVEWSGAGVRSIDALLGAPQLKYFHLGSSPSLASIQPLAELSQLRWLGLENIKLIRDVAPLGELTGLEGLSLEGSMWTTQHVRTLEPIGRLRGLRYLNIANLRTDDGTLAPLYTLTQLERFIAAKWWPESELAEIRRLNPRLAE